MRWWQRALLYLAVAVTPGVLVLGPEVSAWPRDAVLVTLVLAFTLAVSVEGLVWFVEGFTR